MNSQTPMYPSTGLHTQKVYTITGTPYFGLITVDLALSADGT